MALDRQLQRASLCRRGGVGGWPEPRARFAAGRAHPPLGGFHSHACHREGPRRESLPWPASHTCRPAYPGSPLLLHHLPLQALLHFLFLQRPVGLPACSRLFHTRLCCWALHSPCRSQLESFCSPTGGPRPARAPSLPSPPAAPPGPAPTCLPRDSPAGRPAGGWLGRRAGRPADGEATRPRTWRTRLGRRSRRDGE